MICKNLHLRVCMVKCYKSLNGGLQDVMSSDCLVIKRGLRKGRMEGKREREEEKERERKR